ncbi:MAG: ABC transporter substrate-binding protein [Pseudomonadota bacterium]|nr:ABC transporter substrate-binding protein [Pseudomonadota bacterium]
MLRKLMIAGALAANMVMPAPVWAADMKDITWAAQDDAATMDPHAFNHGMTMTVLSHIYEGLVRRDKAMAIEPALAESWDQPSPTIWRFKLRDGVAFHDGRPLTADDVAFSFQRAMSDESDMKIFTASIVSVRAVDASTVEIETEFPNAALIQSLPEVRILSKSWAEANGALSPSNVRKGSENFATLNANGTGPFRLVSREPDVRTVLEANPDWWDTPEHNIGKATLVRIASGPTRVAALLTDEVDFAYPIPLQDIARVRGSEGHAVLTGPEIRTMFLSMDQARDVLLYSSVKDGNPFKDQRVRQAFYQALDIDAIADRIMRGSATPTGNLMAPGINSVDPSLQPRAYPFDPEAAKSLLAEAGYGDGFSVTLDCPNDRYVNDEAVCQAVAAMLAKIGVDVDVNAMPAAQFFPKVGSRDSSFNFFGYTPVNLDAFNTLSVIVHSPTDGRGQWNVGDFSDPRIDELIEQVLSEMDPEKRTALVTEAMRRHQEQVGHVPLYQQGLSWGMRKGVETPLQIDNRVNLAYFNVN